LKCMVNIADIDARIFACDLVGTAPHLLGTNRLGALFFGETLKRIIDAQGSL
jgi:hypothetical protein